MKIKFTYLTFALILLLALTITVQTAQNQQDPIIPDKLYAAEIHYSRIPHQYWQHRLQMVKAMGFNALSVYIMWNFHEIEKGKFDYQNGDRNLVGFLDLAKTYGLKVLFRPGPYVCAEWDFGGFPARLFSIKDLKVRENNKPYLEEVKIYFTSLAPIVQNYSHANNGPIVLLQIENQYGFYGTDKSYIQALRDMWKQVKVEGIPQYYVDWIENIQKCHWDGANIGINDGITETKFEQARKLEPNGYLFGGEIYSGWLTHWGENWAGKSLVDYNKQYEFLMSANHSFSMYMAHGGTNFGLTAGANEAGDQFDYNPCITSYDYDAPINEQGSPTAKYHSFRQMAKKYATWAIPQIPASINTITINPFIPAKFADFLQNLPEPTLKNVNELISFEDVRLKMWNQGFVGYKTSLSMGTYEINITIRDFALVYLNGKLIEALSRAEKTNHTLKLQTSEQVNSLMVLVESMGHIHFGALMPLDIKGLVSFTAKFSPKKTEQIQNPQVKVLSSTDFSWDIYKIPIDQNMLNWKNRSDTAQSPRLFRYNLTLSQAGDTYLNMQNWKKGYVFVNGYNLGRYWQRGPQQKLFVPGVWLKKGVNDIVVLDLLMANARFIKGQHNLRVKKNVEVDKRQQYQKQQAIMINFNDRQ